MIDNKTLILAEFEKHKGEFVITDSWDVQRLIAIGNDKTDYYYIMYDGRGFKWFTCVGSFIPLKGKIDDKQYEDFIRRAKLNHFDQIFDQRYPELVQDYKKSLLTLKEPNVFLTEVCWDIN